MPARLKGKVDYAPLLKRLRKYPVIFLHELDRFFTKKQIPLIIRDLQTLNTSINCYLEIRNLGSDIPGAINEGIIHYQPKTLIELLCYWLDYKYSAFISGSIHYENTPQTRQRAARFWRLYLYRNMNALLHEFSRWS